MPPPRPFVRRLVYASMVVAAPAAAQAPPCPSPLPASPAPGAADPAAPPPTPWDLRCIELFPTARGGDATGMITLSRPPSPFAVTVTAEGRHVHDLTARIDGLGDPAGLGDYTAWVAWATPLSLDPVVRLGPVANGEVPLGRVDFSKYLIWITAEASADVTERAGPLVLRGRSPSTRMEAHDLLATAPSATQGTPGGDAMAGHDHGAMAGDGWPMPPANPDIPMLPGIMALRPDVSPLMLEVPDAAALPEVREHTVVTLPDGGTLDLQAGLVRKRVAGRDLVMLAFNGQHPGPLIRVEQESTIFVNFTNETPFSTAVHWHGLRLDNRYDGVPGLTQDPVRPGESFRYTLYFPDAGIYWYHPHHREDIQQELGLYGNMLVDPLDDDGWSPVHRDEVLMLDDLLLDDQGPVPFGEEAANYALMGRFGTVQLVNGETEWSTEARSGEVVRFHLTNASNTRTYNLSLRRAGEPAGAPLPLKVVATDVGRFEREERVESVVLAPAQRYVVDVRFPEAGRWELVNHVHGINHRMGVFLEERSVMGTVDVSAQPAVPDLTADFETLRTHDDVIADIDRYRHLFDGPIDHELVMTLEGGTLPAPIREAMQWDWVYTHPVEWTGTMSHMNWASDARDARWTIREPATGRENRAIDWRFRVGDVVKIRVHNDRSAIHVMQHPLHIHGQRFLVVSQDGVPTENLAWKDTVLLPAGSTTDLLLELSNPGRWMVHCHIAEHLEAGMTFVFEVEGAP